MDPLPQDPVLAEYAQHVHRLQWSAILADSEWKLAWVSDGLKHYIRATDDSDLGHGRHIVDALYRDAWVNAITPESAVEMFATFAPFLMGDLQERGVDPATLIPERFLPLLEGVEPTPVPPIFSVEFHGVDPHEPQLRPYPVRIGIFPIRDTDATVHGWMMLFFMGIRPNLLGLLARGNQDMYQRMANLVDPGPRQAAILFCDLEGSGPLSRQLPSISYFRLVRELWTGIDNAVADNKGIVGKHAGDGASAYFIVDDLGGPSAAATAAINTARAVHDLGAEVFRETIESPCLMRVGLHWGGSLYMGQLVPGGRLDVTALGDEVNEAARIQEAASAHETLVSKNLLEQLHPDDAAACGIDLEKLLYRTLAERAPDASKIVRDAGSIPVVAI